MYAIDYHADDYAISVNNSKRMLELVRTNKLDSFSIISNMGCYAECMDILKKAWPTFDNKPLLSVHLNLIDGYRLSSDDNDIQNNSWGKLFLNSFIPFSRVDSNLSISFFNSVKTKSLLFLRFSISCGCNSDKIKKS